LSSTFISNFLFSLFLWYSCRTY